MARVSADTMKTNAKASTGDGAPRRRRAVSGNAAAAQEVEEAPSDEEEPAQAEPEAEPQTAQAAEESQEFEDADSDLIALGKLVRFARSQGLSVEATIEKLRAMVDAYDRSQD